MSRTNSPFSLSAVVTRIPQVALQWVFGLFLVCFFLYLLLTGSGTVAFTLIIGGIFMGLLAFDKSAVILATIVYLSFMGDLRKMRDLAFPHPSLDALILIPPVIVATLGIPLLVKARLNDPVSKAMAYLTLLMILQMFNPSQGGLSVGIAGALFSIVPVLWFWVGRKYATPELLETFLYSVVMPIATLVAVVGIYQTFFGPLPYQQAWFDAHPELALLYNVGGGRIRAFGFFNSPAEYAMFLTIGTSVAATGTGGKRVWALTLPLFFTAMILVAVRGALVKIIFALVMAFVLRKGKRFGVAAIFRIVALLILSMVGVSTLAGNLAPSTPSSSQSVASLAVAHEAGGLADPLNQKKSTVGIHGNIVGLAIMEGFRYPIGHGIGYTTGAAAKFGSTGMDSEVDLPDTFISLGLVGGFLYLFILILLLRNAIVFSSIGPPSVRLATITVLFCGLGSWLLGQSYCTSAVWMFLAGAITRPHTLQAPTAVVTAPQSPLLSGTV